MIVFNNKCSKNTKNQMIKQEILTTILLINVCLCLYIIGMNFTLNLLSNLWGYIAPIWYWIVNLAFFVIVPPIPFIVLRHLPYALITFDDEYVIIEIKDKVGTNTQCKKKEEIKSIIDFGTFYKLTFNNNFLKYSTYFEKENLMTGTIEEFERIYGDFIIKKTLKGKENN